jgi:ribosomal protein L16 Arg81 hydroxylase
MMTLEQILAPLEPATFERDYLWKRPVHIEGTADKFKAVMDWPVLNRLLGMTSVWSAHSLQLVLDKEPVPAATYATAAPGRDGGQVLRPDPAKVKAYLKRGATLVANDIDQLAPELSAFCAALEAAIGAKLQVNLYLSSKRKQGFKVHFDTHDVFAVHVMGEKTWMVYQGRAEDPIAHHAFKGLGQEHHEKAKGELWKEVRLKPGDLLYLPRGQYHYALADEGPCAHLAVGATYPIGMDVVSYLFDRLAYEPVARANLPQDDPAALAGSLRKLGERIAAILAEPARHEDVTRFIKGYRYDRETYDLPGLIDAAEERFAVAGGFKLVEQGGRAGIVRAGTREAVEVPPAIKGLVAWTLDRQGFARSEIARAFPAEPAVKVDRFLVDMQRMGVLAPQP